MKKNMKLIWEVGGFVLFSITLVSLSFKFIFNKNKLEQKVSNNNGQVVGQVYGDNNQNIYPNVTDTKSVGISIDDSSIMDTGSGTEFNISGFDKGIEVTKNSKIINDKNNKYNINK